MQKHTKPPLTNTPRKRGRPRGTARLYSVRLGTRSLRYELVRGNRPLRDAWGIAVAYLSAQAPRVAWPTLDALRADLERSSVARYPSVIDPDCSAWVEIVYHSPALIDRSSAEGE